MTKTLLYIRSRQFNREAKGLGLYLFVFIAVAVVLFYISYYQFKNNSNAWYIIVLLSVTCLGIQYSRKDKGFIYKQLENLIFKYFRNTWFLHCLFQQQVSLHKTGFISRYSCCCWLSFLFKVWIQTQGGIQNLSYIIPASNYEWLSGIRKIMFRLSFYIQLHWLFAGYGFYHCFYFGF